MVMGNAWQLQEAKNRFSEVVDEALENGPQVITRRGVETAVLISYAEYRRLRARQGSLSEFFRSFPLVDEEIDLARERTPIPSALEI
jgi:antitoxin Phd